MENTHNKLNVLYFIACFNLLPTTFYMTAKITLYILWCKNYFLFFSLIL